MTNEELLQSTLNATIQRIGKQATQYEAEIANLNAQIAALSHQLQHANEEVVTEFSETMPEDISD